MKTTITNGTVRFTSESLGAEPWILTFSDDEVNYIWRPSPDESGGTPVCFPLLGAVPDNTYRLEGKTYSMGMHGFAQFRDFSLVEKTESSVLYQISETPETLAQYPWRFCFQIGYALEGAALITEYRVKNRDAREMYFSVGGHPRFSCPIGGAGEFGDSVLEFEEPEGPRDIVKSYSPRETIARFMDGGRLCLDYSMFEKGAFCFKARENRVVTLKSPASRRALRMFIGGEAWFQLWTAVGAPFIAMEPWYGSITSLPAGPLDGDWKGRRGTLRIAAGEEYRCSYSITIIR
jgi:galactose mutarotase-like enzyme